MRATQHFHHGLILSTTQGKEKKFKEKVNTTRKKATSSAGKMPTSSAGTRATSIALQLIVSSSIGSTRATTNKVSSSAGLTHATTNY